MLCRHTCRRKRLLYVSTCFEPLEPNATLWDLRKRDCPWNRSENIDGGIECEAAAVDGARSEGEWPQPVWPVLQACRAAC